MSFCPRIACGQNDKLYQVHVPLPHVFPPSAIRQSPTGRKLDAIDFVAIAIPSLRSLRRAHIKRRRLIMPLVALVQKNHSAPATSYSRLVLGAPFLVAAAPRVPSSLIVSASIRTQRISKVRIASHLNCEQSEQYHLP